MACDIDVSKINRFEVINHAVNGHPEGRVLVLHKEFRQFKELTISVQDDGKTLKVFLK